jgi:hypothetical protein
MTIVVYLFLSMYNWDALARCACLQGFQRAHRIRCLRNRNKNMIVMQRGPDIAADVRATERSRKCTFNVDNVEK